MLYGLSLIHIWCAVSRMKGHWFYLIHKFEGAEKLEKQLRKAREPWEYEVVVNQIFSLKMARAKRRPFQPLRPERPRKDLVYDDLIFPRFPHLAQLLFQLFGPLKLVNEVCLLYTSRILMWVGRRALSSRDVMAAAITVGPVSYTHLCNFIARPGCDQESPQVIA